jgi:adenosylmethionine-8-amino-7-oxononanoate aminotransferase
MGALWHPFSDMGAVERGGEFVLSRGEGAHVFDTDGRRYLDATAGLWFTNIGHGRREVADASAAQLGKLAAYSTFGDVAPDVTVALAERLAGIAPVPGSKVFLTSGGSDSVDTAAKLARRYWTEMGQPQRRTLVGRQHAYHGSHWAGTAVGGIQANADGYGDVLVPDTAHVAWDDPEDLRATIERIGAENVAAFFCEPVIGAGGVYPPPEDYLMSVRKICTENEVLFIADEVITGYGRIGGSWFASTRFGLEPDLVTTAKGLTSGYMPMGAVLVAPTVAAPFFEPDAGRWFRHGYTYSGHAGAAAVAMTNLDIIEREGLLDEAARLERTLADAFAPLAAHERVAEVRSGTGAVAAVQLATASEAPGFVKSLRAHGVSGRAVGAGGLQVSPAFVMTDEQVHELVDAFAKALDSRG